MRDTRCEIGSALIMTVVLTVLLAVVGIMFVMSARVDNIATSYISENRELYAAVDTVIEDICRQLVDDVPDDVPCVLCQEYYDYPGDDDPWLASLEPYQNSPGDYRWRHITDLYADFAARGWSTGNVQIEIVPDGREIVLTNQNDEYSVLLEQPADADGDGVSDSKWIRLNDIMTSKGRPIYAAVRIIDNGGMLNVNTGYKFDPSAEEPSQVDGSSVLQIDLEAIARSDDTIDEINSARNPGNQPLSDYQVDLIWRIENPATDYLPFDISDELELRNRYFLTTLARTRLEMVWLSTIGRDEGFWQFKRVPYDGGGGYDEDHWWRAISQDADQPDRRHFLTTYNMDRIINPNGDKMVNINDADEDSLDFLYNALNEALNDAGQAAQIAVNLIDYHDDDEIVTVYPNPDDGVTYYGFERPCVYISELAHRFQVTGAGGGPIGSDTWRSYAVELYKPYIEDVYPDPDKWRVFIDNSAASPPGDIIVPVNWSKTVPFHVIKWENEFVDLNVDSDASSDVIYNLYNNIFDAGSIISLQRCVDNVNGIWISVDSHIVPDSSGGSNWLVANDGTPVSIQRDITLHKCIRRLWASVVDAGDPQLGQGNDYLQGDSVQIQAHPANSFFTNVGEIGLLFCKDVYGRTWSSTDTEADVRVNLTNPVYQNIFNYLTVFDPSRDGINNDGDWIIVDDKKVEIIDEEDEEEPGGTPEWKIPGRININTAPWFVLAQLPWVTNPTLDKDDPSRYKLAQAIVAYRDKLDLSGVGGPDYSGSTGRSSATGISNIREGLGFESIGELNFVIGGTDYNYRIDYYIDGSDQDGFPDLTPAAGGDGAVDDFEERDLIFTRLSNLVTVRSDVFTAYILVRIGTNGPQKRVIAILDRSGVYPDGGDVKIVAWQPVADPR